MAALSAPALGRLLGRAPNYDELYGLLRDAGRNAHEATALLSRLIARWPDEEGERHDLVDLERVRRTTSLGELLPLSFGPEHLAA